MRLSGLQQEPFEQQIAPSSFVHLRFASSYGATQLLSELRNEGAGNETRGSVNFAIVESRARFTGFWID
jgi:hypothetical protein